MYFQKQCSSYPKGSFYKFTLCGYFSVAQLKARRHNEQFAELYSPGTSPAGWKTDVWRQCIIWIVMQTQFMILHLLAHVKNVFIVSLFTVILWSTFHIVSLVNKK